MQLGIDDPEAWLAEIPQRVFDLWYAYYQCEPFGKHWEQTATIASMIGSHISMSAASVGRKLPIASVLDFLPGDSMTWKKRRDATVAPQGLTRASHQQTYLKSAFGFY